MSKKYYLCAILSLTTYLSPLSSTETAPAEEILTTDFDSRLGEFLDFTKVLQKQGLFDGEILLSQNGKTLLNLKNEDIAYEKPQFMIGSISKQFFAVALLKSLYDSSIYETEALKVADVKNRINLPISQFLPQNSAIWNGNMPAWADYVTLHHLLSHTSGILNYTASKEYEASNASHNGIRWHELYRSPNEMLALVSEKPLSFSPGSQFSYCNTGYVIIAEAIEAITRLPVEQYLQIALFDPIGLSSSLNPSNGCALDLRLDPKSSELVMPLKYDPRGDQKTLYPLDHYENISVAKGAGSIISTTSDLLKWNIALHKEKSLLPQELYNLLITPILEEYGYGIRIEDSPTTFGHAGGISAYCSLLLYVPEHDLSIILLSNVGYDFDKIEEEIEMLNQELLDSTPDEKERNNLVSRAMLKKYPGMRGYHITMKKIRQMLKNG